MQNTKQTMEEQTAVMNIQIRFTVEGDTSELFENKHFEKFYDQLCNKLTEIDGVIDADIDLGSFELE